VTVRGCADRQSRRRIQLWIAFAALLVASIATSIYWADLKFRQSNLDAALIQSVKLHQTDKAIAMLNVGASGNAVDRPYKPLTLRTLMSNVSAAVHGRPVRQEKYPSALMLACAFRVDAGPMTYFQCTPADVSLIRALLSHGARADASAPGRNAYFSTTRDSLTALDTQIMSGHTEVVKLLLDHGAPPDRKANPPASPLLSAVAFNRVDVATLLLAHGVDPRALTPNGATVLQLAAYERCIPMLDLLLSHGLDINARDKDGWTPLMDAVKARINGSNNSAHVSNRSGQPAMETVRFLLMRGADASIRNRKGQMASILAMSLPDPSDKRVVVRLLMEAEAARGRNH
jgi:hypothetical protein